MTTLDELEKRLEGPGLIVALTKDEALALLSAAREGERMREALTEMFDAYGPWTGKTCKQERADDAARAALSRIDAALAEGEGDCRMVPVVLTEAMQEVLEDAAWFDEGGYLGQEPATETWAKLLAVAPDHIGNSTTMVPALGVEGAAQIIFDATYDARHGSTSEMEAFWSRCDEAARAIIAAMEKNQG